MDKHTLSIEYEIEFQSRKWVMQLPFIQFKPDWLVKIIPPTGAAIIRFLVAHKDNPSKTISVYFDGYGILGYCKEPYWEMYPYESDVARFVMNETEELIEHIDRQLKTMMEG